MGRSSTPRAAWKRRVSEIRTRVDRLFDDYAGSKDGLTGTSARIAQAGGDGVDRDEKGASQLRFLRTGPVPPEQFDL